ncbi:hypothetical protein DL347_29860 [Pseudomonas fluorescens]|uniref:Uncharacterized protein n=1 Tax=Pseudomonas fluorescens TaxID=294 RepID=A0A7Z6MR74_PSEFL|nr:hypothetical protein DL347_29860 [Pseudomonas fluorescens]
MKDGIPENIKFFLDACGDYMLFWLINRGGRLAQYFRFQFFKATPSHRYFDRAVKYLSAKVFRTIFFHEDSVS